MVSIWCGCEGHLLSGVEATCTVLLCALEAVVGLPSHTQCRHHHRHGLCTKHFSRAIYQPLSPPNSWWYWKPFDIFKVSGNWPLAKFLQLISNWLKLLKMLWNQILMCTGLFSLLTDGRFHKKCQNITWPRVSPVCCLCPEILLSTKIYFCLQTTYFLETNNF